MNKINLLKNFNINFLKIKNKNTILADKCNKFRIYKYSLKSINSIVFKFRFFYTFY